MELVNHSRTNSIDIDLAKLQIEPYYSFQKHSVWHRVPLHNYKTESIDFRSPREIVCA